MFMIDVTTGMAFLHSTTPPRIHRDIKPENMLVTETWRVKIADFGTAKLLGSIQGNANQHPDDSRPNSIDQTTNIGTLYYMAPELYKKKATYGPEVDVYSFGISMWVICNGMGEHPYKDLECCSGPRALRETTRD
eukprot:TRINITY_DN1451_c0_g2_i2.p1 TRINITY_DN1451_c0_g2~~TRINITY_DN1451_c0_g2_i2.p1  ORF type:complete len:135 (+),score=27.04 TRINITY_DN1451_c0_g2_i2:193-597(+)